METTKILDDALPTITVTAVDAATLDTTAAAPCDGVPTEFYVSSLVQLLDLIEYKDENYAVEERVERMKTAYQATAVHFAQPHVKTAIDVSPRRLEACIRAIVGMVVCCWVRPNLELTGALTIFYTYFILMDDTKWDGHATMETFVADLVQGKEQRHPRWQLVNAQFPALLEHYGPFCGLNMFRGTINFFQGCWIQQSGFNGYLGDNHYPDFLRRFNGVGHAVGSTIWPKELFDEKKYANEITTAVNMLGDWEIWTNDLLIFWKEFDDVADQNTLIRNIMATDGCTVEAALHKLTAKVLDLTKRMMAIFADKDPLVPETIVKFVHGYVTWQLSDERYRMVELFEKAKSMNSEVGRKFCTYFEGAREAGGVDPALWAIPPTAANDA